MLLVGENHAKFGDIKDNLSNSYLIKKDHYPNNRAGLVSLLNNWNGYNKQPTIKNTTTVKHKVASAKKDEDKNYKNGKRVNAEGKEQCHHCGKKYGKCINSCPDLSTVKWEHIKKDLRERWVNKNGNNHTLVGEVVDVLDVDLEVEASLSMIIAGKTPKEARNCKRLSLTIYPMPTISPITRYILTAVSHTSPY